MPRARASYTPSQAAPTHIPKQLLFQRRQESLGFNWHGVDSVLLKAMISAANQMGVAIMFTAATGGRGVCVKVYQGKIPVQDVALDEVEFARIATEIIEAFASPSEDIVEALRGGN